MVGVDFVPAALAEARTRAQQCDVQVDLIQSDILEYDAAAPFDLVLDSGCLHHLPKGRVSIYRERLDAWLAPGGSYVLVHFAHRPRAVWIPAGPKHMARKEAVDLFAPLELQAYDETTFDVPLPMGRMRAGVYWFTRPER